MKTEPETIIDLILRHSADIDNIGLFNGKMGIAICLFHVYGKTHNALYKECAEALVDDVWEKVGTSPCPLDFENGLAGMGWGIEHLVQNGFLKADTDDVLSELDDKIFQHLINYREFSLGLQKGLLGFGFYLLSRLRGKGLTEATGRDFLLKRLMIDQINQLYDMIQKREDILKEPVTFKIDWALPWLLVLLAEARKLNFYDHKTEIVLNSLSSIVLSMFPIKMSNRLFLSMGMEAVVRQVEALQWHQHIALLQANINEEQMLSEFPDKNITVSDGLSGIGFCLQWLNRNNKEDKISALSRKIAHRILHSGLWQSILEKDKLHPKNLGLYDGIAGVGYSILYSMDPAVKIT